MKYVLQYSNRVEKDFRKLDKKQVERIVLKLEVYCANKNPLQFAKALSGNLQGIFCFRIGVYRVIFEKDARARITILTILRIKHRKEVYRIF